MVRCLCLKGALEIHYRQLAESPLMNGEVRRIALAGGAGLKLQDEDPVPSLDQWQLVYHAMDIVRPKRQTRRSISLVLVQDLMHSRFLEESAQLVRADHMRSCT
ncbi:hypothetical protein SKAU_G00351900 [Synaphobranchus kaupii]|uniref:Uncharacterized protein n=1 Tax=Synaphobranchus kaupii TaxID=118154 RepID=A0A9Q1EKN1_SYNKA|nr:hypothetical protein SKAU_G00351900 [Synaphobranchus kaupii]